MATLTIRNLPDELIERLKASAKAGNRSMEQEVRELLEARYQKKSDLIQAIKKQLERAAGNLSQRDGRLATGRATMTRAVIDTMVFACALFNEPVQYTVDEPLSG